MWGEGKPICNGDLVGGGWRVGVTVPWTSPVMVGRFVLWIWGGGGIREAGGGGTAEDSTLVTLSQALLFERHLHLCLQLSDHQH